MPKFFGLIAALLAACNASAQGGPFWCQSTAGTPALIRAEGIAERVSDIVLTCTGGTQGVSGFANITVSTGSLSYDEFAYFSTYGQFPATASPTGSISSRIVAPASSGSEALLVIDELSSTATVGTNVIQGVQLYPNSDQITFNNVPIQQPGSTGARTFRIANIRVYGGGPAKPFVLASVSISGATSVPVNQPVLLVGIQAPGANFSLQSATGVPASNLTFGLSSLNAALASSQTATGGVLTHLLKYNEGFTQSFGKRNTATAVASPAALADQNVPGTDYHTESGLYLSSLPGASGLNVAGLATQGSRLVARFTNVSAGVALYVTTAALPGTGAASAALVAADSSGTGAYSAVNPTTTVNVSGTPVGIAPVTVSGGSGTATWELLDADAASLESYTFGLVVAYAAPQSGTAKVAGGLGPLSTATAADSSSPVPRFTDVSAAAAACAATPCLTAIPAAISISYQTGGDSIPIVINVGSTGAPLSFTAAVAATQAGWTAIAGGGATPSPVVLTLTPQALPAGVYQATVTLSSPTSAFAPVTIPVILTVTVGSSGYLPFACTASVAVPPTLRAEGISDTIGDVVLTCINGTPTASGVSVPRYDITFTLNAPITSRVYPGGWSEALLIVDEPFSGLVGTSNTQTACIDGSGACTLTGTGTGVSYSGATGHPNLFPGRVSGNTVTFPSVPIDPAGTSGVFNYVQHFRVLRIVNVRTDATAGGITGPWVGASVLTAAVSIGPVAISHPVQVVGFIQPSQVLSLRSPDNSAATSALAINASDTSTPQRAGVLRFSELFGTAFKTRTTAAYIDSQTSPAPVAQNMPGQIYNCESWFYAPTLTSPVVDFTTVGLANAGTRLRAQIANIPSGARVFVSTVPVSFSGGTPATATTGPMARLVANEMLGFFPAASTTTLDGIPGTELTVTGGAASAVWEVLRTNPATTENLDFVFWVQLSTTTPTAPSTITASYAPAPPAFDAGAGHAASSTQPIPRFIAGSGVQGTFVALASTAVSLYGAPNPLTLGQAVTLTAVVAGGASSGRVTFYDGTTVLGISALSGGQATLVTRMLPSGVRRLYAYYSGDGVSYAASRSATVTETVNAIAGGGFQAAAPSATGATPWHLAVGDFNGDGKMDLAVPNYDSNTVSVLLGNGNGTFQTAVNYPAGANPRSVAAGDFNGDGNTDLAVANSGSNNVSVLLGNGNGSFQTAVSYPASTGMNPGFVVVADFNRDGIADLAVGTTGSGSYGLDAFLGNGDGTFQAARMNYSFPISIAAGDFDKDGTPDLAADSFSSSHFLSILQGNGDGSFTPSRFGPGNPPYGSFTVTAGDLDGDGNLDLVTANQSGTGGNTISVFMGHGDGTFRAGVNYAVGDNPTSVAIGDFNGDGKADLAVANSSDGTVTILTGSGDGTFGSANTYAAGVFPSFVAVSDFNGDGIADLAVSSLTGGTVGVLLGRGSPELSVAKSHTGNFFRGQTGATYTVTVTNVGPDATSGTVIVTETVPNGMTLVWMAGTGWTCPGTAANNCTRSDALNGGESYPPITVTVNVNPAAGGSLTNQVSVLGGGSAGTSATDPTTVLASPTLVVLGTHGANFVKGQSGATYSLTVSNSAGAHATVGSVTVTETVPAGLTLVSMAGTGWTCPGTLANNCTRSDALDGGTSFPPIIVTVNVSPTAPDSVTNQVSVNGGGSAAGSDYDVTGVNAASAVPSFLISTLAGGGVPPTAIPGTQAAFGALFGVATDQSGNVYFSSDANRTVYKLDVNGTVTRVAGTGSYGYSGDNGPATSAQLGEPRGLAADGSGNLYIADPDFGVIRKVAPNGIISTVAGTNWAFGVAVDGNGNLYIADYGSSRIRKLDSSGITTTIAGTGTAGYSGDNGPATSAQISYPYGVAVDALGNVYIADANNSRIRKVNSNGTITTVAGNGSSGNSGDNGLAVNAQLYFPSAVAVDSSGNLYISGLSGNIRKVNSAGIISAIAGTGTPGFSGDGGPAASAQLNSPQGVAADASGNLYIADNYRIRKVSTAGTINTVAGYQSGDGSPAVFGAFRNPLAVARDSTGNTYVADFLDHRVRKIAPNGTITNFAGTGIAGFSGDGGPATSAQLNDPEALATDSSGNVYIGDLLNCRVRKVAANGTISTFAGMGSCASSGDGGLATRAGLSTTRSLLADALGNLYIGDNSSVRKVNSSGIITTIAGSGASGYSGDGGPAVNATLWGDAGPSGLALDTAGNLYIADGGNNRIRRVGTDGIITTVAGSGSGLYSGDNGQATSAGVPYPTALVVDAFGNLYISGSARIRAVSTSGVITTVAGNGSYGNLRDGGPATQATLWSNQGLAIDTNRNIYITDTQQYAIRMLTPVWVQPVLTVNSSHSGNFSAGQTGTYTVTVTNAASAATTSGTVTVTEILRYATVTSMSGTGWNCGGNTCTRSDTLAGGASYPPITVTVNVPATAPSQITHQVTVSGGGGAMGGASDLTLVNTAPASLAITKTHTGNFVMGQAGTYTVTVSNSALAGPTSGTVTVTETVPAGMTLASMAGAGWTCPSDGTTCTRNGGPLASGASYPPITVTVNVSSTAPASATNQVSVSGGGSANANASDSTIIEQGVSATSVTPGAGSSNAGTPQTFSFQYGDSAGAADFTSVWGWFTPGALANGSASTCLIYYAPSTNRIYLENDAATAWQSTPMGSGSLSNSQCTVSGAGASVNTTVDTLTLNVPVTFSAGFAGAKNIYMYAAGRAWNSGWQAKGSWSVAVVQPPPSLTIAKTHPGNFTQGQTGATYTITVSNANGAGATSGLVTVIDALPSGLTATAIGGTGWGCTLATLTCTRSDTRSGGSSFDAITVTVNIAANAPSQVINQASVSGGGSTDASATDSTIINSSAPAVSATSVTPGASSGNAGTPQTFSFHYSDTAGAADFASVWGWFTAGAPANGSASTCLIYYAPSTNRIYLENDAATAWQSTPMGSGSLSNSQCTVSGAGASATTAGNTVTLNVPVSFTAGFAGAKNIYMYGAGSTLNSGWQAKGSWSVAVGQLPPTLTIAKAHTGNFSQGQTGATYTITVTNANGASATSGLVTVIDNLPSGLTATAMSGTGWGCTLATLTCTRSDARSGGSSFEAITVTVTVASGAGTPLINQASVSGGGSTDASATDSTIINSSAPAVSATSVTPGASSGNAGTPQTFMFQYSDTAGAADFTSVWGWFTAGALANGSANTCLVYYAPSTNRIYLENDAATAWQSTPMGSGSLSNSQCTVSGAGASVTNAVNTLTLNVPVTLTSGFAGAKNIYMYAAGSAWNSGWQAKGSWSVTVGQLPPTLTIAKTHTGNFTQGQTGATYTITVSNANGASATSGLVTVTDALPSGLTATAIGGTGWGCTLATLTCTRSDTRSGGSNFDAIKVTVTVASGAGTPLINQASVSGGGSAGANATDSTIINSSGPAVSATSVTPGASSGNAGAPQTFSFQYSDTAGAADFSSVWGWFTAGAPANGSANTCLIYYAPSTNRIYLENDAATAWQSTPMGSGSLSNSQCTVSGAGASVTTAGVTLTLNVPVTFTSGFAGAKNIYMYGAGSALNSGWQAKGTWSVTSVVPGVSVGSVAPASGSGNNGTPQTFVFQYSDAAGAGDFASVWGWFTPGALANGSASTCLVYYAPSTNRIYLENDAAAAWQSTLMGSGSLSNSQCTVNAAGASVTAAGNTLTLSLPIAFTYGFAGVKNIYMYAAGGTLGSGWYNTGSWTVQ